MLYPARHRRHTRRLVAHRDGAAGLQSSTPGAAGAKAVTKVAARLGVLTTIRNALDSTNGASVHRRASARRASGGINDDQVTDSAGMFDSRASSRAAISPKSGQRRACWPRVR